MYKHKKISTNYNETIIAKDSTAGITLIALVVTIIVLIILAGISINLILGDNGIINKAREAAQKSNESAIKEQISLAVLNYEMSTHTDEKTGTLANALKEEEWCSDAIYKESRGVTVVTIKNTDEQYEIEEDGTITKSKIVTSWYNDSENEFIITTAEQLAGFAELVNEGNNFNRKNCKTWSKY